MEKQSAPGGNVYAKVIRSAWRKRLYKKITEPFSESGDQSTNR